MRIDLERVRRGTLAAVAAVTLAVWPAPASAASAETKPAPPNPLAPLPASFSGLLPCADCAGIRYRIDFLKGGAYLQRTTYLRDGRDESFYELGRWTLAGDGRTVSLDGGRDIARWAILDRHTLRQLDPRGGPIDSALPYQLARGPAGEPIEPRAKVSGMFRYQADAARFRECRSGLEWPVAMSEDYRSLERAYLAGRPAPGAEVLVWIQGRVESQRKPEGGGSEPTLVVEKFLRVSSSESCGEQDHPVGLEDSRWRLTRVGSTTVEATPNEPWMVLDSRQKRMTGSGGCNRISGDYDSGDGTLRFGRTVSTMMACPSLEIETEFLGALDATRRYRVTGRVLELMNSSGTVVARFEEANLK
jgi:copper homeostasis protein (lipoprotein)